MQQFRRVVEIAIASPSDVKAEKDAVLKVFTRWNGAHPDTILNARMWEFSSVPTMGDHPQHILNTQIIEKSDLLVAILWSRLGKPTPTARSGTVEEIREFVKYKGPQRMMLYFCKRPIAVDTPHEEMKRLQDFKAEMKEQGLVQEFSDTPEFEGLLYAHLDVKVKEFLDGKLPLPIQDKTMPEPAKGKTQQAADPRLKELISFGSTPEDISREFLARMDQFDAIQYGPDKFLDLGAHAYTSAATCIDDYLARASASMTDANREALDRISMRFKTLAAEAGKFMRTDIRQFWIEGRCIGEDLKVHAGHMNRTPK